MKVVSSVKKTSARSNIPTVSVVDSEDMEIAVFHFPEFGVALGVEMTELGANISAAWCCPTDPYNWPVAAQIASFRLGNSWAKAPRKTTKTVFVSHRVVKDLLFNIPFCQDRESARTLLFDSTGLGCAKDFPQVFSSAAAEDIKKAEKRFALAAPKAIS